MPRPSTSRILSLSLVGLIGLLPACSSEDLAGAAPGNAVAGQPALGTGGSTAGVTGGSSGGGGRAGAGPSDAGGAFSAPEPSREPYPSGPYGRGVGATIANLSFYGFRAPAQAGYDLSRLEVVKLSDFYNPEGGRNDVRVIVLNSSAVWCTVCRAEYERLQASDIYRTYRRQGIEIIGLLFEDRDANPAKPSDLVLWGRVMLEPRYPAVEFPLLLDPGFKSGVYFTSDATPMNMLIDAHTMQILNVTMGFNVAEADQYFEDLLKWIQQ